MSGASLLVVVHPGSACGSASMYLGSVEASQQRHLLARALQRWTGHVLVIDGDLSDELPDYKDLQDALIAALSRARTDGYHAERMFACDMLTPQWPSAVAHQVQVLCRDVHTPIRITGAWYFPDNTSGCVNAVQEEMVRMGYGSVAIDASAIIDPDGCTDAQIPT